MSEFIKDGTGKGYLLKIDANNRIQAFSTSRTEDQAATEAERSYNINTGIINLTNDSETPVLYFKNNENSAYHITAIAVGFGATTGGSGDPNIIKGIRNPDDGTIISTATDVDINSNRNFGSANTLEASVYKGATGLTLTGGNEHIIFYQGSSGRLFASVDEIVPKGSSFGITITPQSGNTSLNIYVALISHLENGD